MIFARLTKDSNKRGQIFKIGGRVLLPRFEKIERKKKGNSKIEIPVTKLLLRTGLKMMFDQT